ncbi:MAG: bifunctional folylpolyglutamate synthase/dihydrofolate synthase [bacterium]|nr:bifunctional folylpolyglutamate synthase/dihydrofolate synthase [bacterium]
MNYDKAIDFLYSLERFGIQFGLEKITYLLSLLNDPQDTFKSIHIAGTNGKGSTSSFIASVLKESGLKTGLYTSPHLVDFRERIQINGVLIPRKKLTEIVEKLIPLVRKTNNKLGDLTYFEVSTAIAFEYFKEEKVDFACIEVGMGGRLDATNVITPLVSIITSIGFDHTKELGNTLGKIAFEKAGIIKKNVPLVCGVTEKEPLNVIRKICKKKNSKIYLLSKDFVGAGLARLSGRQVPALKKGIRVPISQKFSYKGIYENSTDYDISLLGEYQIQNASMALAVIEILGRDSEIGAITINLNDIRKGLKNAKWPGRFEIVCRAPTIIIDGAHNPPGASVLAKSLRRYFPDKKINFILGILKDKDISGIVKELMPLADKIIVTSPHCDRASSLDEQAKIVRKYHKDVEAVYPIRKAIKRMVGLIRRLQGVVQKNEIICITGSLYTVGEARKALCKN